MKTMKKNNGKAPSFQFYPADWLKDPALRLCSFTAKGVWIDIICISYEMPTKGLFVDENGSISGRDIVEMLSGNTRQKRRGFEELKKRGVIKQRKEDGAFYVKRLQEDMKLRELRREAGSKGGNPALLKQEVNQTDKQNADLLNQNGNQNPTPSSSSSPSGSPLPPKGGEAGQDTVTERAIKHVARLVEVSDYAYHIDPTKTVPKARATCENFTDDQIIEVIDGQCRNAKGWELVDFHLNKQKRADEAEAQRQAAATAKHQALVAQRAEWKRRAEQDKATNSGAINP